MRLSYRQLRLSIHLDHGAGVAVTGGQRDELVEPRADAILASAQTAAAYAEHFEAQMDRGPARKLLSCVLRIFRRPGVLLAVILVTCGLLGYAAATVHQAPGGARGALRSGGRPVAVTSRRLRVVASRLRAWHRAR